MSNQEKARQGMGQGSEEMDKVWGKLRCGSVYLGGLFGSPEYLGSHGLSDSGSCL